MVSLALQHSQTLALTDTGLWIFIVPSSTGSSAVISIGAFSFQQMAKKNILIHVFEIRQKITILIQG